MNMPKRPSQKGIALFFALIFILIVSVLGVSIMFVSQLETWSSLNYREMTQARYGAEAGLNSAANFIVNTFCAPGNTTCTNGASPAGGDTLPLYNTNVSPVTLVSNGAAVTLSTTSSASNYPVASVETAFRSAALGSIAAGLTTVNYTATATLIAMNLVTTASGPATVQTWSIKADGAIGGIRSATEEVTGVVEQQVTFGSSPLPAYGVFATGSGCNSIQMSGGTMVKSYNSSAALSGGSVVLNSYAGNVGTNGNLSSSGSATVYGTLSTPRTGAGYNTSCNSGAVDAFNYSGGALVSECGTAPPVSPATTCGSSPVQLPQPVSLTAPTMPTAPSWNTSSGVSVNSTATCTTLHLSTGCSGSAGNLTFTPTAFSSGSFPNINVNGGAKLTLSGSGTFNVDGIVSTGGGSITLTPTGPVTLNSTSINVSGSNALTINNSSPVTVNLYGDSSSNGLIISGGTGLDLTSSSLVTLNIASTVTSPFNGSGGTFTNATSSGAIVPGNFQIFYGGTSTITLSGGAQAGAVLYAPNAPVNVSGGTAWYGAIIGSTVNDSGGANIYYDTQLSSVHIGGIVATVQPFMMDSFSWARF